MSPRIRTQRPHLHRRQHPHLTFRPTAIRPQNPSRPPQPRPIRTVDQPPLTQLFP
ncbi:hypothetical protein I307_05947 [Cryptococcus deuterogattii 99/473]|nr:hypothetical protein I307_05947 [Cryptococcus deuterogattii 99/473]